MYYLVPFIFSFALIYGILSISNIFNKKNVNILLALTISFFAILYEGYIKLIYEFLPILAGIFIVLFVVILIRNLFITKSAGNTIETLVIIGLMFLVFLSIYNRIPLPSGSIISSKDVLLVIGLALVGLIILVGYRTNAGSSTE